MLSPWQKNKNLLKNAITKHAGYLNKMIAQNKTKIDISEDKLDIDKVSDAIVMDLQKENLEFKDVEEAEEFIKQYFGKKCKLREDNIYKNK